MNDTPPRGWRRLTVHAWFVAVLAVVAILVIACAVVATVMLDRTARLSNQLIEGISPARVEAAQLENALLDQETGVRGYLLTGRRDFLEPYSEGVRAEQRSGGRIADLLKDRPGLVADVGAVRAAAEAWRRDYAQPAIAAKQDDATVTAAGNEGGKQSFDAIRARLDRLSAELTRARTAAQSELDRAQRIRNWAFVAMVVLFLLAGIAIAVLLRRAIGRPLDELRVASRHVATGDFGHPIPERGPADIRELSRDVDLMRTRLVRALQESHEAQGLLRAQTADLDAQAVELRRSNAELEQFAYVASHDLQEPLRKIATFCQLLQKRYGSVLDERGAQYIHFAVDGATRMQVLINDLLSFSRVGRMYDDRKPVDLDDALDKALDDLSTAVEESDARVERPDDLPTVTGDRTLLGLLWQNLLGNAIKFRRAGERPEIRVECVRGEQGEWLLSVSDNGIGIEPEFAEKVFVIFQRLHNRETYGGTGIGLAMCRKIVENHGGRIWLDTGYTGGTRICFTLPDPALDPVSESDS
ncbi:CHASE3 domain-containing protein [Actinomadura sp. ATCC 31491]|uniref:histidine kinase n=1 Tax=Actinomadura luzonensis TaxID=2805427 RepID=A0ABT0FS87_9ACTN|nr:sensor histidine kinase [Actinomadura luzonensis]MCK2215185.1 CHASE3 domain-containing protein [Actinomadura luzonensis]